MSYTNVWGSSTPPDSQQANQLGLDIRNFKLDVVQRINTVLGTGASWDAVDPIIATLLNFGTTASPQILGGATDLHFRNNANNADNLIITDAGNVSISRGSLLVLSPAATNSFIEIRTPAAGNKRSLFFTTNGSIRWESYASSAAESGSNVGSDFNIARYADAGTFIDNPLSITRATGLVTIANQNYFSTTSWEKERYQLAAILSLGRLGGDGNGIQYATNALWTGTQWNRDDVSAYAHLYIQHLGNLQHEFRIAPPAANPITWTVPLIINVTGITCQTGSIVSTVSGTTSLIEIRGDAGQQRNFNFRTGVSARWQINTDNGAESGSNAGSNFNINRYDDTGAFLDTPITISRATGRIIHTATTASAFALTGVVNASAPSMLDMKASSSGVPGTYNRAGGLYCDFSAGAISKFGIFADSVALEIKSTDNTKLITILNQTLIQSQLTGTPPLLLDMPDAAGVNSLVVMRRATVNKFRIGFDASDNFAIINAAGSTALFTFASTGQGTATNWNANTGFQIGGGATSGHYLRGNGTSYVDSAILAGDLPTVNARIYRSAAFSFTQSTFTAIPFDATDYDPTSMHSNSTNNTRITVATAGKYKITAHVDFPGISGQNIVVTVRKNGVATDLATTMGTTTSTTEWMFEVNCQLSLAANDYIEVYVKSDNASPFLNPGSNKVYAEIAFIGN